MTAETAPVSNDATHLFYHRLRQLVVQAGSINRAQLDELYRRFRIAVERVVPEPVVVAQPAAPAKAGPPAGVRRNHLLRLLTAAYSPMFEPPGAGEHWEVLPRRLVGGIQSWLDYALGPQLMTHMNEFAGTILEDIDTNDDKALWRAATTHPGYGMMVRDILVRLAFKFEDYEVARGKLLTIAINSLREHNRQSWLTEGQADQVLYAIFYPLKQAMAQNRERIRVDFMLGDGTALRLAEIVDRVVPPREGEESALAAAQAA